MSTASAFKGIACGRRATGSFILGAWVAEGTAKPKSHGHAEAHFMYVPDECGYVTEARGTRARSGAHLIFNPAGICHSDRLTRAGRFFSVTLGEAFDGLPAAPSEIGRPDAHSIVARLARGWDSGSESSLEALCLELVGTLSRAAADPVPPHWLDKAVALLRSECGDISVAEAARRIGVHPVHLARTFRRHLGLSPGDYLHGLRVARAAHLLSATRLSTAEIAQASGFADQSHLTKQFRRAFGMPPAAYRRHVAF